ncbi:MAG: tetratricopeptide (TPR) repeat protein [Polaribacter sp.]|jgi:tetratricopeptide (TPR) repeat protein
MNIKNKLPLIFILSITVLVFFQSLGGEYLNWDDNQQITNNQDVLNFSWQSIKNYFSSYYVKSYQPLASLSFGIEYYTFGNNSLIPHITNLFLHGFNIILVYFLIGKISPNRKILNFFVVAVFAIHPFQGELLGWISTRSTLLFSFFFLLSTLSYLKYISNNSNEKKYFWLTLLFFVLSLLSKASAIVFPFVLFSLDYLVRRKLTIKVFIEKIPFFIGSIVIGIVSLLSRDVASANLEFNSYYTWYEKISISSYSVFLYIKKSFIANDFFFFYGYPYRSGANKFIDFSFLISPLWIVIIAVLCWIVYRKLKKESKRLWVFGILFFVINIAIVVNVTSFSATFFAERYMYLSIIGVFVALSVLINALITNAKTLKNGVYIILGIFLISLGIKSFQRSSIWKTDLSLWTNVEKNKSQNSTPYRKLGQIYAEKGQHQRAVNIYNNGIKINPLNIDLYYWRALSIIDLGDLNYAKKDLNRVINAKHQLIGDAFYQKSLIYRKLKMIDSAKVYMDSAKYHNNQSAIFDNYNDSSPVGKLQSAEKIILKRVDSLIQLKKFKEVEKGYEDLLVISPSSIYYLMEKGKIESSFQKWDEAITTFAKIISIEPDNKIARLNRAYAYSFTKNSAKSIEDYTYVINTFEKENGEIYYFRALAFLKNNQTDLACKDVTSAKKYGYKNIAKEINQKICKE